MQAPSTTRVCVRVSSLKTPSAGGLGVVLEALGCQRRRERAQMSIASSTSPSSAPTEQQPWPRCSAGSSRMPRQPRPQMHVQFDSRKSRSKRQTMSPASISSNGRSRDRHQARWYVSQTSPFLKDQRVGHLELRRVNARECVLALTEHDRVHDEAVLVDNTDRRVSCCTIEPLPSVVKSAGRRYAARRGRCYVGSRPSANVGTPRRFAASVRTRSSRRRADPLPARTELGARAVLGGGSGGRGSRFGDSLRLGSRPAHPEEREHRENATRSLSTAGSPRNPTTRRRRVP